MYNERSKMPTLPCTLDLGGDAYVNLYEVAGVFPAEGVTGWAIDVPEGKTPKACVLLITGMKIPVYRAPDIIHRRWQESFGESVKNG
jgi:hypothetical protein